MKRLLQFSLFFIFAGLFSLSVSAQEKTITGKITDKKTKQGLVGANVVVKGTATGATTDIDGKFSLKVDVTNPVKLEISYVGYEKQEVEVNSSTTTLDLAMAVMVIPGQEVVISGSRVSETIQESSASIQKMSAVEVREIASGDFYQGLSTMKGVDISTSSMGFQAINMRGFNTTAPVRMVQFVDGMDNQAPGLNFPVGNMVGLNDLDINSVEVITGAASALYGPNAFQGVVSMTSKNPYDYEGLSIQLKAGSRSMADGQIRYAKVLDKKRKFAIKVTGSYFRAENWVADDSVNIYGDIETEQNLSAIVEQQQYNEELTQEERDDFIALNNYLGFNPTAYLGLGKRTITAPGYYEQDLADPTAKSIKASAGLHYRIKDSLELSYNYRIGSGTTTYQGANRYSINNLLFQQHKLELNGKNFNIRAYTTQEDAGDSYDIVFSGIGVSRAGVANYIGDYLGAYFDSLKVLTNDFDEEAKVWMVEQASSWAESVADSLAWPAVGSYEFDSLLNDVKGNADLQKGSKFTDKSSLQHIEAQYNFDMINFMDMQAGASFRRYDPHLLIRAIPLPTEAQT
jgi:outer membrane receptor protein involved in Fe transport